jgi:hypothetical protein
MSTYERFRASGMNPPQAWRAAKILRQWGETSSEQVRLVAEGEQENYFDVYGEPDAYTNIYGKRVSAEQARKELIEQIERNGCYCIHSEYFDGEDWQLADSVGMCAGYRNVLNPFENWYVVDLMQAALDAMENAALMPAI